MQRKHILKSKIRRLVSEFEERSHGDTLTYFDEKELMDIISFYEREQLLHKAIDAVDIALTHYKYRLDFYLLKARLLMKDRDYDCAIQILEEAEIISPFETDIQLMKARALNALGRSHDALAILEDIKLRISSSDIQEVMIIEAAVYEQLKDYDSMFDVLKDAVLQAPHRRDILERMWMAVEFSKKYEDSILFHKEILDQDPYNGYAWYNLGHAYACIGEYEQAIDSLEYSFLIEPQFEMAYKDCAEMCIQLRNYPKALDIFLEELDLFGPDSDVLASIGYCYIELGDYSGALNHLKKAAKLDPYNDEVFYYLGRCYFDAGSYDKAERCFLEAIEGEDRREEYFASLAMVYIEQNEITKADYYFRKATEAGPEQLQYWLDHAKFLINQNAESAALSVLEEAEYHTVGAELIYGKVVCLFKMQQPKEAFQQLELALREDITKQDLLFKWMPELQGDTEVHAIIDYFIGEITL